MISFANAQNERCLRNTYLEFYSWQISTLTTSMKIATLDRVAKRAEGCSGFRSMTSAIFSLTS